jgi:hypothetical protein
MKNTRKSIIITTLGTLGAGLLTGNVPAHAIALGEAPALPCRWFSPR